MAHSYDHLREKAIQLRTQHKMTLDEIVERLALPKTTIYYWIRDIPIPRTDKQSLAQRNGTASMKAKYAGLRDAAYQQGLAEATELLKDITFRDFVVLYMAEGYKRNRNVIAFVNSDPVIVRLGYRWIAHFASNKLNYTLQYHADHNTEELKAFWANFLDIDADLIKPMRKSNSNQLSGRQFRSVHGLLTVSVGDTYFRSRMQAWMDFIKNQW